MFDILDLVFQLPKLFLLELFLLGTDKLLSTPGAFLSPTDVLIHVFNKLVSMRQRKPARKHQRYGYAAWDE
jgi:hypothetical protein